MNQYDEPARDLIKAMHSWMQKADENRLKLDFSSVFIHYAKKAFHSKAEWWRIQFMKPKFLSFKINGRYITDVKFFYHTDDDGIKNSMIKINDALAFAIYQFSASNIGIDKASRRVILHEQEIDYSPKRDLKNDEIDINEGKTSFSQETYELERDEILSNKAKLKKTYGYLTKDEKEWQPQYDFDELDLKKSSTFYSDKGKHSNLQKLENFDFTKPVVEKAEHIDWSNYPNMPEFSLETKQIINTVENFKF